jgi:DNA-binding beta-propeller fold protein YncE
MMAKMDLVRARTFATTAVLAMVTGLGVWSAQPRPALAATAGNCVPAGNVKFICNAADTEDWAPVPGTHWVIGSDLAPAGQQGFLHLFDTRNDTVADVQPADIAIRPDKTRYPDCPGPVDMKIFGPHGLDLTRGGGEHRTLYAVNHGGRESVEVFAVDLSGAKPSFAWTGCVVAPKGFWPDGVASLPDGGIIVTSLWDPTDQQRSDKLMNGKPVGGLDEWQPGKGWSEVPGSAGLSGPNGVIVSADGREVYVAVWSGREVARISRGPTPAKVATVPTGFLTDNLRWSPDDRMILVGGQDDSVKNVITCFESTAVNCNVPFKIDIMNPKTLKLTTLVKSGVYGVMGAGTGAIEVDHHIWVSSFRADRIAIFPAPHVPGT